MDKLWSKSEIAHLERHADSQDLNELAQRFHTDTETVRKKIEELGLSSGGLGPLNMDAEVKNFEAAIQLLYDKKYEQAAAGFEKTIAESEVRQLSDRARQYLQICRERIEEAEPIDDPYLAAVYEKNQGNLKEALEICEQQGDAVRTNERFAYLAASIHALGEDDEKAVTSLARAIELEPKNRVHAYHDPDFASLRGREEFSRLMGSAPAPVSPPPSDTVDFDSPTSASLVGQPDA